MGREEKVLKVVLVAHLQQNPSPLIHPSPLIPKSFCIQAKQAQHIVAYLHNIKRLDYEISHILDRNIRNIKSNKTKLCFIETTSEGFQFFFWLLLVCYLFLHMLSIALLLSIVFNGFFTYLEYENLSTI